MTAGSEDTLVQMDRQDPLAAKTAAFDVPAEQIYLDGNSLGCLPVSAKQRAREVVEQQWGQDLIKSWNLHQWIDLPFSAGEKIARLIGAAPGQTICCDSISVNIFKLLSAALMMHNERHVVLSQQGNFPTDLYMVQGLARQLGEDRCSLRLAADDDIASALTDDVAVLLLSHVNFRSGALYDMQAITEQAQARGILVIWDLAHSAGVVPVQLDACRADFAVGCGYKYLNGGPGAPAFLYVARRHQAQAAQPLSGWMGHMAPFDFDNAYQAAPGVAGFLTGTPPVISLSILDAALDVFADVDVAQLRQKSLALAGVFMQRVAQSPLLAELQLLSPVDEAQRGAQLAYRHPHAFAICQALIAHGVIADFRAPDILRVGFSPLFLRFADIGRSVDVLSRIMRDELWRDPAYAVRHKVT
ncbi:kynureninase [Pseudohongiella acticola]|uniref:Kynureninase n=1 Tax=Pseudohongiella acticola TaxID=1524254 RepID=A0A1E8CME8_9GAMM|nr:kynureninase [Pseudohongiella acticola]OFE13608.1 kynureninase [Pseudohongiella acticola]